jgi:hypothetical protein
MLLLLTAGMLGNLLLLPSLLTGPVGRWITRAPARVATATDSRDLSHSRR